MKTDAFDELAQGEECFVVIHSHDLGKDHPHFERTSKVFKAKVAKHYPREGHVQVHSEAAKHFRFTWQYLSFRWEDGVSVIDAKHTRLIVAQSMAEQQALEDQSRVAAYQFPDELPMVASARALCAPETIAPADAPPRTFELFQAPEDFE